jgi:hypothetical protein
MAPTGEDEDEEGGAEAPRDDDEEELERASSFTAAEAMEEARLTAVATLLSSSIISVLPLSSKTVAEFAALPLCSAEFVERPTEAAASFRNVGAYTLCSVL